MHIRICKYLITVLVVTLLWINAAGADTKVLTLVDSSGSNVITVNHGDPIAVEVRVDDASTVAGASFTVTYNADNLAPSTEEPVTSSFFGTFVQQGLLSPPTDPAFVTVPGDSTMYYSPMVNNPAPAGLMIAAARVDNGSGSNIAIFTLHFELTGVPGSYPISIVPSIITNTDAGYDAAGEPIPLLVGIGEGASAGTYPSHTVATPVTATIIINPFTDTDHDGIDDNWEIDHAPAGTPVGQELAVYTATGDYDHDGYSDLQEYLNRNEPDPDNNPYDPEVVNPPGGTGYVPWQPKTIVPAINLLLLSN